MNQIKDQVGSDFFPRLQRLLWMQVLYQGAYDLRAFLWKCRSSIMVTGQNAPSAICAAALTTCERAHQIYSDKLRLSIINLKHIDLATEADKAYHIDEWAALFQSGT